MYQIGHAVLLSVTHSAPPNERDPVKRTLTLVLAAVIALSVSGCSGTGSSAASTPATVTVTSSVPPTLPVADFHRLVREDVPSLASTRSDEGLDKIGKSLCGVLEVNDTTTWLVALKALLQAHVDAGESGVFIGYAAAAFCPEKESAAPQLN